MTILFNTNITIYSFLFLVILNSVSSSSSPISPSDHCSSSVPELTPDTEARSPESSLTSPARNRGSYFTREPGVNGSWLEIDPANSAVFRFWDVHKTDVQDLFSVRAVLRLATWRHGRRRRRRNRYSDSGYQNVTVGYSAKGFYVFTLQGFWSKSHGLVCVVGESEVSPSGESNHIPVILKLNHFYNSTNITNLVTGTLESLALSDQSDSDRFDPVSIVLFPSLNYDYSMVSKELSRESIDVDDVDVSQSLPLESLSSSLCTLLPITYWDLRYSRHCRSTFGSNEEKCSPLRDFRGPLPVPMMIRDFECREGQPGMRFLIKFPISTGYNSMWDDDTSLDPKATLVGEGVWDPKRNRLFAVACRFLKATDFWSEAGLGDCSTRLSLRFPAVWTIGNTKRIVGHVWSAKNATEPGYFEKIGFQYHDSRMVGTLGVRYEYTKIEKVEEWCSWNVPGENTRGKKYPDAFSEDMSFGIVGARRNREIARGYVQPISVEDRFYKMRWYLNSSSSALSDPEPPKDLSYTKMSYRIVLFNVSIESSGSYDVSAEGVYDATTGRLCMVGCRNTDPYSSRFSTNDDDDDDHTSDCEILVNFQFPAVHDSEENEGFIKGIIESKRKSSDPLYFRALNLTSIAYVSTKAEENIWEVDWEIMLGLVSNTLACAFVAFQIFHLRRNPDSLPYVSITMLLTQTFACTTTLALALISTLTPSFQSRDVLLGAQGWLEAKGLIEGVTALFLLLLFARLVQLTRSARLSHENRESISTVEKEAFVACLPLFLGGAVLCTSFARSKRSNEISTLSLSSITSYNGNVALKALISYSKLLVDWFLVPQVILNVFRDSREKCLSCSFYVGMTLLHLLTNAYGLYMDLDSALNTVLVSFGSLIFAVIIYLQQKFHGRCVLPLSLRKSNVKVTNVAETQI